MQVDYYHLVVEIVGLFVAEVYVYVLISSKFDNHLSAACSKLIEMSDQDKYAVDRIFWLKASVLSGEVLTFQNIMSIYIV